MAYRSGLMRTERIEEAFRNGDIRGLASAMEMGVDIPDLQVGFNLRLPHSVGRVKQRVGGVGRTVPVRFVIVAWRHAFQFYEDSLAAYWYQPVEPSNPNIRNTHGRCLARETDLSGMALSIPSLRTPGPSNCPKRCARSPGATTTRRSSRPGSPAARPQLHQGRRRRTGPHRSADARRRERTPEHRTAHQRGDQKVGGVGRPFADHPPPLQEELLRPSLAGDGNETVITARHASPRKTRPITLSGATVTLQQPRISNLGHLEYSPTPRRWPGSASCAVPSGSMTGPLPAFPTLLKKRRV